jgi:hypothetical protein
MEQFTVTAANGWQTLSSLLELDATFKNKYIWSWLYIRNTSANTVIIKSLPGATAPSVDSGTNLTASAGIRPDVTINPVEGFIDGRAIWIKASAGTTTIDVTFVRKAD